MSRLRTAGVVAVLCLSAPAAALAGTGGASAPDGGAASPTGGTDGSSGGTQYFTPPVVQRLECRTRCTGVRSASRRRLVGVEPRGLIRISGRRLGGVRTVVFLGARGTRDDARVAPQGRPGTSSLSVRVPARAASGSVVLIDRGGLRSSRSRDVVRVTTPPPPPPPPRPAPRAPRPQPGYGFIWPVDGPVTSPYGPRWGRLHAGIDIGAPTGTPIRAAAGGRVILRGPTGGYGHYVCIAHRTLTSCYAHLSQYLVVNGQSVGRGQLVGRVGCTGNCYGDHLHFEMREGTQAWRTPRDPMRYLPPRARKASARSSAPMHGDHPVFGPGQASDLLAGGPDGNR